MTSRPSAGWIRAMELATVEAWPPRERALIGGWIVGLSERVSQRANSALAIADPLGMTLLEAIDQTAAVMADEQIRPSFKIVDGASPPGLDPELAGRGWPVKGEVDLMTAPLGPIAGSANAQITIETLNFPTSAWVEACWPAGDPVRGPEQAGRAAVVRRVRGDRMFFLAKAGQDIAAAGLGVITPCLGVKWVGVEAMHCLPGFRRQGVGASLLAAIARYGIARGAKEAWLQVETSNAPAIALYRKMGFSPQYRYWYRADPAFVSTAAIKGH